MNTETRFKFRLLACCLALSSSPTSLMAHTTSDRGTPLFSMTGNRPLQSGLYPSVTPYLKTVATDKGKVDYNKPPRTYVHNRGRWNIYVEAAMRDGNMALYRSSLAKLKHVLNRVYARLPATAAIQLSGLKYFLLWGQDSPLGGRTSGMSYIRRGEPANYFYLDRHWGHALVIYSAKNLMYLDELWSNKAVLHELAHAWHITHWPERHPPIYQAWRNALNKGLYRNVQDIKGRLIPTAYARKNQLEYFAELSAMYFVGGNYFPYNRRGLRRYDPEGYRMVESLWQ